MKLQQFVKKLPKHLVYAPIYRKGVEIKSKEGWVRSDNSSASGFSFKK